MFTNIAPAASQAALFAAFSDLRRATPNLPAREASAKLGVSEAELVAARCAGGEAVRLAAQPRALLERVPALGRVTARSQSRYATLASNGTYGAPDIGEHTGIVVGDHIDLRIFPSGWTFAYGVTDAGRRGPEHSLQIFDAHGAPAHTVALGPASDLGAYQRLVAALATIPETAPLALDREPPPVPKDDADIDVVAYRGAFAAMQDTHDFFMLLRRFGLAREQGLRLADGAFARPLARTSHRALFARATVESIPLMLFVANEGIVQISSGVVPAATEDAAGYRLSNDRFELELDEGGIARAWMVRKPTSNGIVTSLELYDASGTLVLQVFGERHEGSGERPDWARAMSALP
jgi:putative hemin transport protein